jgi:hypothetical protein
MNESETTGPLCDEHVAVGKKSQTPWVNEFPGEGDDPDSRMLGGFQDQRFCRQ